MAYTNRGITHLLGQNYEQALTDFNQAIQRFAPFAEQAKNLHCQKVPYAPQRPTVILNFH